MPLSKKRNRERMKEARVQPKLEAAQPKSIFGMPIRVIDGIDDWGLVGKVAMGVQPKFEPLPNCIDGRYRKEKE